MIFSQLYSEGLHRELGTEDTTALFTTARRKAAVNDAQLEFVKQTECFTREVSIPMVDGTREYDLDAAGILSAEDFLSLAKQGVEFSFTDASSNVLTRAGDDFLRIDIPVLNVEMPGWRNVDDSANPTGFYIREEGGSVYIGLHQPPAIGVGESAILRVPYVAVPATMVADGDEPFSVVAGTSPKRTLRPWHQAIVHYAAALLEPLRKNYQGEQRQRQLFAGHVADYLQRQRPKGGRVIRVARNYYRDARGTRRGGVTGVSRNVYP